MAKQRELQSREADQAGHQVVRGKQIVNFSSGMIDILPGLALLLGINFVRR